MSLSLSEEESRMLQRVLRSNPFHSMVTMKITKKIVRIVLDDGHEFEVPLEKALKREDEEWRAMFLDYDPEMIEVNRV